MNKNNKGLFVLIGIFIAIILSMGIYIAYDKGVIFSSAGNEEKESSRNEDNTEEETEVDEDYEIKALDLSKCLNNSTNAYRNASDVEGNYGLSMKVNSDKKSVTLSVDWGTFGPLSTVSAWTDSVATYNITGFSKNVDSVFVGDLGQDAKGITLFYLMSDGTVEYTPMFIKKTDSQNNIYYDMNYVQDYSSDGKVAGQHLVTKGPIVGVSDVVKLYTVDASNGSGWKTTIGATRDGSFYDLGDVINNH